MVEYDAVTVVLLFQSELCSVIIPELEFTTALTTMPGKFTTLEGLLGDVASQVQLSAPR